MRIAVGCCVLSLWAASSIFAQAPAPGDVPAYKLAEVPRQMFARGTPVVFQVAEPAGSTYSVTVDPEVRGPLAIDPHGTLTFAPAAGDAGNFTLTVKAKHSDGSIASKQVVVSVFENIAPEYTLVAQGRKAPAEDSPRYITITETEDPVHRKFNNQAERKLVNVVISGKTVVLDKNADGNAIMTRFDGRADVASFSIYAQTLIVRSTLHLPATTVHLSAKDLRFEDGAQLAGTAAIVTTPLSLTASPGQGSGGADGLRAGSVSLTVGSFFASPGTDPTHPAPRFVLTGGSGQDAGQGKPGDDGTSMPCYKGIVSGDTCVVHIHQFAGPTSFGADNSWPGDGQPAIAPGAPGVAGGCGDFTSNLPKLNAYVANGSGKPGAVAQHVNGGRAGNPHHAINAEQHERSGGGQAPGGCVPAQFTLPCIINFPMGGGNIKLFGIESEHYSQPGTGADAPPVPNTPVAAGVIQTAGLTDDWLHPIALRAIVYHAQDAYLDGDLTYTQQVMSTFIPLIDRRLAKWDADAPQRDLANQALLAQAAISDRPALQDSIDRKAAEYHSLAQIRLEMSATATRLANNLDYFGHPAGWVPQLSLAATLQSYSNEITADIPILYLAYYVQESSADRARHLASLQAVEGKLQDDIDSSTEEFNAKLKTITDLEVEAGHVSGQLDFFQQSVANEELVLKARADQNIADANSTPFWKTGLKVLSAVATVCPVGQPAIGAIGVGLGVLSNAGDQSIMDTAQQLSSVSKDLSKEKIAESINQYHTQIATLSPAKVKDLQSTETYVKGLVPLAQGLAKEYQAVNNSLATHKETASEVDKEVAQLEAGDPVFQDLSQQVTALNIEKEKFTADLSATLTDSTRLASQIMSDWTAADNTNRAISVAAGDLDHEAVQEVAAFGRRTRDRLLEYQYYLAKAYEYRLLQPYQGDLHLDKLLDELVKLTSTSHDDTFQVLSDGDYKNLSVIYSATVQDVISDALNKLQNNTATHETTYSINLSPAQLAQLNSSDGLLPLNLGLAVEHVVRRDNRRLVDITVADGEAGAPTDGSPVVPIVISFDHGGTSTFRNAKQSYSFTHGRSATDEPFHWSGNLTGTHWSQDNIAPEYIALLKQLLNLKGTDKDYIGFFAYPGLESTIAVTRQGGDAQPITKLSLLVTYDYDTAEEAEYPLDVLGAPDVPALISVSAPDNSERTLGQGSFTRYYPQGTPVTLTAPAQFGTRAFLEWDVEGQPPLHSPVLKLNTTKPLRATVKYSPAAAPQQ